jgi:hypothetical protein
MLMKFKLLVKESTLRLGSGSISEIRNHPFFAKIHWKQLEAKKLEPPLKPHLEPNKEVGLDPWASVDGDDSNFEILSNSQQEVHSLIWDYSTNFLFYYFYIYIYY